MIPKGNQCLFNKLELSKQNWAPSFEIGRGKLEKKGTVTGQDSSEGLEGLTHYSDSETQQVSVGGADKGAPNFLLRKDWNQNSTPK